MPGILFVGDIAVLSETKNFVTDDELKERFAAYDLRVCNVEGPISNKTLQKGSKRGPYLLQNESSAEIISQLGFSLFCLANNHIMDYGKKGLEETVKNLSSFPEARFIGAGMNHDTCYAPVVIRLGGMTIGVINAAETSFGVISEEDENSAGYAWLFSEKLFEAIKTTKDKCDRLILVSHAGLEDVDVPMPEWRRVYRQFIDAGVDVVVGHHPHVVQGWESYKEGLVFYSLGNFIWRKGDGVSSYKTVALGLSIEKERIEYEIIPVAVVSDAQGISVSVCNDEGYCTYLDELCRQLQKANETGYLEKIDTFCEELYKNEFSKYLARASGNFSIYSLKMWLAQIVYSVFARAKTDDLWVYHNAAVETNIWLCKRAVNVRQKKT